LNNPRFNYIEFEVVKNSAGLNRFTMPPLGGGLLESVPPDIQAA